MGGNLVMNEQWSKFAFVLVCAGIFGCSGHQERGNGSAVIKPATPQALKDAYSYEGKGTRPKFTRDPALLIDVIKVGRQTSAIRGMSKSGKCAAIDTYSPAEIKFANGTTKTFTSVTLEGWSGYPPALVKVP